VDVVLKDGSRVGIRPIRAEDKAAIVDGFARLSEDSRYKRFLSPMPSLSGGELRYLTEVDHHDHEALIAFDAETGDGVGVARYVRVEDEVAEVAVAVVDDWQGRGLGGRLLDTLAERAREEDVLRFRALVLAGNAEALRLVERLGESTRAHAGREIEVDVELPSPSERGLAGLLSAAATGSLTPARTLWDRLAFRLRASDAERVAAIRDQVERTDSIVVAARGSGEEGERALRTAAALARLRGTALHLVGAYWPLLEMPAELRGKLSDTAGELEASGLQVEAHLRRGSPADALLRVAEEKGARLIVIDCSPREASRLLPGSVCAVVPHHAPCDVLVVRDAGEAAD
jgi:nucleotide-binding universal stress UspA family protein